MTVREVADLMDDEGNVDPNVIRSIQSPGHDHYNGPLTAVECARLRARLHNGDGSAKSFEHSESAVLRHANGECHHVELRTPPLEWVGRSWRWADE